MRRSLIGTAALVCLLAVPAQAQQALLASCQGSAPTDALAGAPEQLQTQVTQEYERLCAQAVSAIGDVQPAIGIGFTGGNPVLGTGTTLGTRLGAIPRVSATARVNAAFVKLPDVFAANVGHLIDDPSGADPAMPALEAVGVPVVSIQGDVTLGVLNGFTIAPGIGGLGAVDLLGSVSFLPQIERIGMPQTIINGGGGARIGLLEQGLVAPGISVSAMYRRMGEVGFGAVDSGDPAEFATNLSTWSLRGIVSKGLLAFDVAAGAGYDRYSSDIAAAWELVCETTECRSLDENQDPLVLAGDAAGELSTAAWNVFANAALDIVVLNLVAEVGYQKPMDGITDQDLEDSELELTQGDLVAGTLSGGNIFGSVGVRVVF